MILYFWFQEHNRRMEANRQWEVDGHDQGVWTLQRPMGTQSSLQPRCWASQEFQWVIIAYSYHLVLLTVIYDIWSAFGSTSFWKIKLKCWKIFRGLAPLSILCSSYPFIIQRQKRNYSCKWSISTLTLQRLIGSKRMWRWFWKMNFFLPFLNQRWPWWLS